MNDLELNSLADDLIEYLKHKTECPADATLILGIILIKIHNQFIEGGTFGQFVSDFMAGLIETEQNQHGSGMIQ